MTKQTIADLLLADLANQIKAPTSDMYVDGPARYNNWVKGVLDNRGEGSVITGAVMFTVEQTADGCSFNSDVFGIPAPLAAIYQHIAYMVSKDVVTLIKDQMMVKQVEQITEMSIEDLLKVIASERPDLVHKLFTPHTGETH